ncbi:MAG: HAMP domain-containing histidine kinase [Candidatus Ancillula sp.]|jgi:signal transduction histidine kinase|nr:HAMP domain-containing histidine kinase [Candidatus Ancillula sp.]
MRKNILKTTTLVALFSLIIALFFSALVITFIFPWAAEKSGDSVAVSSIGFKKAHECNVNDRYKTDVSCPDNTEAVEKVEKHFASMNFYYSEHFRSNVTSLTYRLNDTSAVQFTIMSDKAVESFLLGILVLVLIIFLSCLFANLSARLSYKRFMKPLNSLDFNNTDTQEANDLLDKYPELEPFVTKIREQIKVNKEFSGNASHELKTPIAQIEQSAEVIFDKAVELKDEIIASEAESILELSSNMSEIVRVFLRIAKQYEVGVKELTENVDLQQLTDDIFDAEQVQLKHQLNINNISTEKIIVNKDKFYISLVISNLIRNALKYAKSEIVYGYSSGRFVISNDTNNLKSGDEKTIFNRFDRGQNKDSNGNGIGLSLIKNLVESYRDKLEVNFDSEAKIISFIFIFESKKDNYII